MNNVKINRANPFSFVHLVLIRCNGSFIILIQRSMHDVCLKAIDTKIIVRLKFVKGELIKAMYKFKAHYKDS